MKFFKRFLKDEFNFEANIGFQKVGSIAIFQIPENEEGKVLRRMLKEKEITDSMMKKLGVKTICIKEGSVSGKKREPNVIRVVGEGTETVHEENGCKYVLDVTKVMFAKGNTKERGRMAEVAKPGETVLDMFAGIGYFTIPLARGCPSCKVIAVDINPVSISYLTINVALNKLNNVEIITGDCKKQKFKDIADRISMGYMPGTDEFLPAAFKALKDRGIIHFHDVYQDVEIWDKPLKILEKAAEKAGYKMEKVLRKMIVKQFGPRKMHVVIDAEFVRI